MKTALIGFTGFVGGNIREQHKFDDLYNSSNIQDIEGKEYDLIVSAANKADMWRINQNGVKDRAEIDAYIDHIKTVKIKKFILISTVGVYENTAGVDENTPIATDRLLPYGVNRYHLEQFCAKTFNTTIVRLPGLFGYGLKKNVIYDLLNDNMVDKIHWAGKYQYYNLDNIWSDIQKAVTKNLKLVNFAVEPLQTKELADYCFGIQGFNNEPADITPANWDMRTIYAKEFGVKGHYLYTKKQTLDAIKAFVERERATK